MKIVIIANGYPDKREPQWGCFERDQAFALKNMGHEVSIFYVDGRFRFSWRKMGIIKQCDNGIDIYGLYLIPMFWTQTKLTFKIGKWLKMKMLDTLYQEYLKDNKKPADIIYAHYLWNIFHATQLKEKYHIPLVGIEHWSGLTNDELTPRAKYWGEIAYSHSDKLLAVSHSLQAKIKKHFDKDSTVVYDMLGQEFVSLNVRKNKSNDTFKFIAVGSLVPIKGYDILIKAFEKSKLAARGCSLFIIGDGSERTLLEQTIKEMKLDNSVVLLGRKTKKEIIHYLSECHVFMLSSKSETFGVACIEALSQGLPTIATKCGGPEEFINNSNGMLIEAENVNSMAKAMCKMYENYGQYDNVDIAKDCLNKFSPQVIARQLTEIFNEVIS